MLAADRTRLPCAWGLRGQRSWAEPGMRLGCRERHDPEWLFEGSGIFSGRALALPPSVDEEERCLVGSGWAIWENTKGCWMSWLVSRQELWVSEGLACSQALPCAPAAAYPPVSPHTCLSACLPTCLSTFLPVCLPIFVPCCPATCLPTQGLSLAPAQGAAAEIPLQGKSTFNLQFTILLAALVN